MDIFLGKITVNFIVTGTILSISQNWILGGCSSKSLYVKSHKVKPYFKGQDKVRRTVETGLR